MINKNVKRGFVFVNLMPYREQIKKEQLKQFYTIIGIFAAIALVCTFVTYSFVSVKIDSQKSRNAYIVKENDKLKKEITEISNLQNDIDDTLGKRKVVEGLQVNRVDAVNILNEVASQLPDGMKLTEVSSRANGKSDLITLKGTTNSNNKVSLYMTDLVKSGVFINPVLIEIKSSNPTANNAGKNNQDRGAIVNNIFEIRLGMSEVADIEQEVKKVVSKTDKVKSEKSSQNKK